MTNPIDTTHDENLRRDDPLRGDDTLCRRDTLGRDDPLTSDENKSPERLEREVDEARARVGRTASELSDRLSPGELLDQALGMAREHGGEFGRNLGAQVKNNPMPLILTSVGISWMMLSNKSGGLRHYGPNNTYSNDSYNDRYGLSDAFSGSDAPGGPDTFSSSEGQSLKDKIGDTAEKARERAAAVGDRIHGRTDSMRHSAENARDSLAEFYREQPLLAGSLGVAIGAALGAMVPPTETEDELLGQVSVRTAESATSKAARKYDEVRASAKSNS